MKNSLSTNGFVVWDLIQQAETILSGLQSENVCECLVAIVQAANLAHTNGLILDDYMLGSDTYLLIDSISQKGLEQTFPDLQSFIEGYKPYYPEY